MSTPLSQLADRLATCRIQIKYAAPLSGINSQLCDLDAIAAELRQRQCAANSPELPDSSWSSDSQDAIEFLARQASEHQCAGEREWGIHSLIGGTHKGPMPEKEAREWAEKFPQAYKPVWRYASDPWREDSAPAQLGERESVNAELLQAVLAFVDNLTTCHVCHSDLVIDDGPAHCLDCSSDCEGHAQPDCTPLRELYRNLRTAITRAESAEKAPVQPDAVEGLLEALRKISTVGLYHEDAPDEMPVTSGYLREIARKSLAAYEKQKEKA